MEKWRYSKLQYVIGCDFGTQALKLMLVSEDGVVAASASESYPVDYPAPAWAEQDPRHWRRAFVNGVRKIIKDTGLSPKNIKAVGIDATVDGVVPVDSNGVPLRNAIIWMDRRANAQCELIKCKTTEDGIFALTGVNIDSSHVAPKILWIKDNEPVVYEKTHKFLMPCSFILHELTGAYGIDYSNASSTMLFNIHTRKWDEYLLELFGILKDNLVDIYPADMILGKLTKSIADETGLSTETSVIVGSGDEHAACIGAGVIDRGLLCDIAGTSEPVCAASPDAIFDDKKLIETHCHAKADMYLIENPGFVSGANYTWLKDNFGLQEKKVAAELGINSFDLLNLQAEKCPPGSDGVIFLPCMMGAMVPEWNAGARGVIYGLTLKHTRGHIIRAIMEASAYGLRDIVEGMENIGVKCDEIRTVGGGAQSRLWRKIKSSVTGKVVALPQVTETAAFGAAIMALVANGNYTDLREAVSSIVRIIDYIEPDAREHEIYNEFYRMYRDLYFQLKPIFDRNR
jgi:xylulokinase